MALTFDPLTPTLQQEYDENETDPYREAPQEPEGEAMDLPEDLQLDEKEGEDEDSKPFGGRLFADPFQPVRVRP